MNQPAPVTQSGERSRRFNEGCGTDGYMSAMGRTGANLHPDRCECQGSDTTPHKHYSDPPYRCARCLECKGYRAARPETSADPYDRMRRANIQRMTPAELAIREAILAVEAVGADIRLTDAVRLLSDAKDRVADYIDGVRPDSTLNVRTGPSPEAVMEATAQHIVAMVEGLSGSSIGKDILRKAGL